MELVYAKTGTAKDDFVLCASFKRRNSIFNYFKYPDGTDELWLETATGTMRYKWKSAINECRKILSK